MIHAVRSILHTKGGLRMARTAPGAIALAAVAWWAAAPIQSPSVVPVQEMGTGEEASAANPDLTNQEPENFDLAVFSTPLWVAPRAEERPAPPVVLPPIRVQLVAVVRSSDGLRAVLFDPDTDTLYSLAVGDPVGRGAVDAVTESGVTLHDPSGTRTLSLHRNGKDR